MAGQNFPLKIYSPDASLLEEWSCNQRNPLIVTQDVNECLSQPFSVAIIISYSNKSNQPWYDKNLQDLDLSQFDLVLIKDTFWRSFRELYEEFIQPNNIKKFIVTSNNHDICHENVLYNPYWFLKHVDLKQLRHIDYKTSKSFLFEVLLGSPRPHRFLVFALLQQNKKIFDNSVITFRSEFLYEGQNFAKEIKNLHPLIQNELHKATIELPYVSPNMKAEWENPDGINRQYFLSGIDIPWKVYENTWYSICTETQTDPSGMPKITGITGKLFLAKRVFIMFGYQDTLKLLKKLGFLTFDTIINEDYDNESDSIKRWKMAYEQVEFLATLDPMKVYESTKNIRDHNYNRMLELKQEIKSKHNDIFLKNIPVEFIN
jgi:hypothetical protein